MATKDKEVPVSRALVQTLTDEQAAALLAQFPVEDTFVRTLLPRLGMISQDKFEGKGKNAVLVAEAGMFFTEVPSDELDPATGKKMWNKTDLGTEIEGIIIFQRKQLRMYDESTQKYTSSPIYDSNDELVTIFCDRQKVATDTPENLKKMYPAVSRAGKPTSKLQEDRILYVLLNNDEEHQIHQLNLHGTSMYAFLDYARKNPVPTVLTTFNSKPKENGSTNWNQMTFVASRKITPEEFSAVSAKQQEIKEGVAAEKAYFSRDTAAETAVDKEFAALGSPN